MAFILETPNALQPLRDVKKHTHPGGVSIRDWLEDTYPGFQEFGQPTICLVNGQPRLRRDWDQKIQSNDVVNFVAMIGDPFTLIAIVLGVVLVAVSIAISLALKMPETPGEAPGSDPVFSNKGKQNTIRLGEPIEVNYGTNRIYPSLASRPYYQYENNEQFQFSLYCIGQGQYQIDAIQIGDTSIDNFQEVSYETIAPGGLISIFQTNIYTSAEAGGQTLLAPNEDDYVAPGYVGPFVVSPVGTTVDHIDIDLLYPRGLFLLQSNGSVSELSITTVAEYRAIDDGGSPISAWFTLFTEVATNSTTTAQRVSIGTDVGDARYEVRLRRTTDKNMDTNAGHEVVWDGMRGYLTGDNPDYGDVTLLAVKIQASGNLNSNTRQLVNVVATRKLPIRDPSTGSWSEPLATRSIIWAFVDVFRNNYGGRVADNFFDWDSLEVLEDLYAYRGEYFDWTFRDSITVWEAATAICQVGRAVPMLVGSLITMRRNGPLSVPVMLFGPDNIVKGSFEWNVSLWDADEFDSMLVEYTEPDTGYLQEEILVTLPGDTTDHPQPVRMPGIQGRNHAYHQALFLLATRRYIRETFSFETGMEGLIASYGDLIAVSHDIPDWGQSGYILAVEEQTNGLYLLHLSQPVEFQSGQSYSMFLRGRQGEALGPYNVIELASTTQQILLDTGSEWITDFLLGGTTEPMIFAFGLTDSVTRYARIVGIEPQGGEKVKIVCTVDEPIVHTFDDLDAPALPEAPAFEDPPDVPPIIEVDRLTITVHRADSSVWVSLAWPPISGTAYYLFQSTHNVSFPNNHGGPIYRTNDPDIEHFRITGPGWWYFRVWAVSSSGAWGPKQYISVLISLVAEIILPSTWVLDNPFYWIRNTSVDHYIVRIYDNTVPSTPVLKRQYDVAQQANVRIETTYTYAQAVTDSNLVRERLIEVDSVYFDDASQTYVEDNLPAELELTNAIPAAPTSLGYDSTALTGGGTTMSFRFFWTNPVVTDLIRAAVWVDDTTGFDPNVETPDFDDTEASPGSAGVAAEATIAVPLLAGNTFPDHYWRVGVFDVWGSEISTNLTAEQTITLPWLLTGGVWVDLGRWEDTSVWID